MLFSIISSQKLIRGRLEEAATILELRVEKLPICFSHFLSRASHRFHGWAWRRVEAVVGAEIVIGIQSGGLGTFSSTNGNSGQLSAFWSFGFAAIYFFSKANLLAAVARAVAISCLAE